VHQAAPGRARSRQESAGAGRAVAMVPIMGLRKLRMHVQMHERPGRYQIT